MEPRALFTSLLAGCAMLAAASGRAQTSRYPFQNPDLPIEQRVNNIISLMTLQEKVAFLGSAPGVPSLGIRPMGQMEGLHGLQTTNTQPGSRGPTPATTFPQAIGMAETWDPAQLHRAGAIEGYEARYLFQSPNYGSGGLIIRAPNADLGRDPRWGRTEECYGEDPFFNGTMAVAFIQGLQGDDPRYWQAAALLKHFLANSNEDGRVSSSSDFDEALFRDYYSVPFRMGFEEGGARCFMTAYNAWNKVPCAVLPVIRGVAMKEWGVDGIITTDAEGLFNLFWYHHYVPHVTDGAAMSLKAGVNQFLDKVYIYPVTNALGQHLLEEADIDAAIRGTLRTFIRLGVLDPPDRNPYARIQSASEPPPWTSAAHRDAVLQLTRESIVLLKNTNDLLPLNKAALKSIAVVGARANEVLLDWYSSTPPYAVTPFQGINNKVGQALAVTLATNNVNDQAVKLAAQADVAIVCVGNHPTGGYGLPWMEVSLPSYGREGKDRQSISLEDEDLVKKVLAVNPRTILVLISSFPYAINWSQEHVPAIVHLTHSSQELGHALADVLFGDYNPAGRLVQTWPGSLEQLPPMMDYNIRDGRTYMYFKGRPLYPFGYGLSYTTFAYSNLVTSVPALPHDGALSVSVDVRNTGQRAGDEVVQLYVKHLKAGPDRPSQELRGFQRVTLQPGENKTVEIRLTAQSLGWWDVARNAFTLPAGEQLELRVGASSSDIRLSKIIPVD